VSSFRAAGRRVTPSQLVLLSLLAVLLGCAAPSASSPSGVSAGASSSISSEWAQTIADAKRETKLVIVGPQGDEVRQTLVEDFQRKYPDIQVDFSGMAGNQAVPRVLTEQAAGLYLTDVIVQGTTAILTGLRPAGALVAVRPFLSGPDVGPANAWRGGDYFFADDEGLYSLMFSLYSREAFIYNSDQVSPAEFTSWRDLLNPKWRGRIVLRDPRVTGGGQAFALLWYVTDTLGQDFIRQLVAQEPIISADDTQIVDWIARGQYAISIGAGNARFREFQELGLPARALDGAQLKEASVVTPGVGNLAVAANPPHPNATKVYLNHLLSAEGQLAWSKTTGFPSLRRDVPTDHLLPFYVPKDGVPYLDTYRDRGPVADEMAAFLRTLIP